MTLPPPPPPHRDAAADPEAQAALGAWAAETAAVDATADAAAEEADAAPVRAEPIDTRPLLSWLKPARSEVQRAQDSERYFWVKTLVLVGLFAAVVAVGVVRVQHTTGGVRVAYELVKTNDELRIKLEANRRLEAVLTGLKNPNALRREAGDKFEMHAPAAAEVVEVD